ncbi:MAG: hypothetical protein ABI240_05780 [Sphingomonas sp.]
MCAAIHRLFIVSDSDLNPAPRTCMRGLICQYVRQFRHANVPTINLLSHNAKPAILRSHRIPIDLHPLDALFADPADEQAAIGDGRAEVAS